MNESIKFSPAMQLANIQGRKTQLRRLPSWQPIDGEIVMSDAYPGGMLIDRKKPAVDRQLKPWCKPGDVLWIKEQWFVGYKADHFDVDILAKYVREAAHVIYQADLMVIPPLKIYRHAGKIRSAESMLQNFSRSQIIVGNVRFMRLQDMTDEDAVQCGISKTKSTTNEIIYGIPDRCGQPGRDDHGWYQSQWSVSAKLAYAKLWDARNPSHPFESNPWVEVIEYSFEFNVDFETGLAKDAD
jgi:hypothetical protein